jgi:hypothetical protein
VKIGIDVFVKDIPRACPASAALQAETINAAAGQQIALTDPAATVQGFTSCDGRELVAAVKGHATIFRTPSSRVVKSDAENASGLTHR